MKEYYECHITFLGTRYWEPFVSILGWKFSIIDGDPVLGEGVKCYATKHFPSRMSADEIRAKVIDAGEELRAKGIEVLREKVELVIWDTKQIPKGVE
jgi:hypothetical protein